MSNRNSFRLPAFALALSMSPAFWACTQGDLEDGIATEAAALVEREAVPIEEPLPPPIVRRGMTWVKHSHNNTNGQDSVGCYDYDYSTSPATPLACDPYTGDTSCAASRPILCIRQDGSGSCGFTPSFYNGWAKGNLGLTASVTGTALTSLAVANGYCAAQFGVGWRMAEFHDGGGGWGFTAYSNLNDLYTRGHASHTFDRRFWVHINDQPGNCWN